jgi:hypothetical protein
MAEAFRPDGRLNIPTQAAADYIAEQGQLVPYEPTMREKTQQAIANFLRDYGGLSNFDSYNMAEGVTGSTRPDARNPMGIGLMDFTPAGLVFGGQEAARDFDKAQTATDYIAPTIGLGLSAVEAFPLTKAITKPAAAFLSNLGRKTSSDIVPTPEPLIASSGPTIPRRTFVQGAVATPVAGALSKLPLGKIDDVAPVAKAARLTIPKNFDILRDLPSTKRMIDDILIDDIETYNFDYLNPDDLEDAGDDIMDLVDQVSNSERFDIADTFDDVRGSMKEELMDIYGLSEKEADDLMKKEGFDLPVNKSEEVDRMKSFSGSFDQYKSEYPNSRVSIVDWMNAVEQDTTMVGE